MPLTQGKYLLTAMGDLHVRNSGDWNCQISVGSNGVASIADSNCDDVSDWTVALTGVAKVGAGGATATLQCEVGDEGGAPPSVDGNASLMAERVNSVSVISG